MNDHYFAVLAALREFFISTFIFPAYYPLTQIDLS